MKRRLLVLLLLLLVAGALLNTSLAWGLAWFVHANSINPLTQGWKMRQAVTPAKQVYQECSDWHVREFSKPGSSLVVVTCVGAPWKTELDFDELLPPVAGIREDMRRFEQRAGPTDYPGILYWDGRGWPCIALSSSWTWFQYRDWPNIPVTDGVILNSPTSMFPWPYGVHELHALPTHVHWLGFLVNSVFYGAAIWLLIASPTLIRRAREHIRIKRGLCPKCAYDLRNRPSDSSACPECGTALKLPHPGPLPRPP